MRFDVNGSTVTIEPVAGVVAGFTGRDVEATREHMAELADAGVTVPDAVPSFYSIPPFLFLQGPAMTVAHGDTSGEAEIAILIDGPNMYVTLASDHTDRAAETRDIGLSKAVCQKVLATQAWPLEEVQGRWDQLELRSWVTVDGERQPYQSGLAAELLAPAELLERVPFAWRPGAYIVLTGTLPAIGGIRPGEHFSAELCDPVSEQTLELDYRVDVLDLLAP